MIIKSISLTNFRNHHTYRLDCDEKTSLILGSNGWGKTSILEAIYILTRGKSFRATDPEIINHDSDFYRIELEYQNGEKTIATYDGKSKTFLIADKKQKRLPKKYKYPVILFLPSDLNLISHSPGRRRDYFDRIFSDRCLVFCRMRAGDACIWFGRGRVCRDGPADQDGGGRRQAGSRGKERVLLGERFDHPVQIR